MLPSCVRQARTQNPMTPTYRIVLLHNGINELLPVLISLLLQVSWDIHLIKLGTKLLTRPDQRLHLNKVNNTLQV